MGVAGTTLVVVPKFDLEHLFHFVAGIAPRCCTSSHP